MLSISSPSSSGLKYIDDETKSTDAASFPATVDSVELRVRQAYDEWRKKYDRPVDESRYPIFKKHYLEQQAWNERNGENHDLNEYGDVSEDEYLHFISRTTRSALEPPMHGMYIQEEESATPPAVHENNYLSALENTSSTNEEEEEHHHGSSPSLAVKNAVVNNLPTIPFPKVMEDLEMPSLSRVTERLEEVSLLDVAKTCVKFGKVFLEQTDRLLSQIFDFVRNSLL